VSRDGDPPRLRLVPRGDAAPPDEAPAAAPLQLVSNVIPLRRVPPPPDLHPDDPPRGAA
jgi:hypothetical protein